MISIKIVIRNNITVERLARIFDLFEVQVNDKKGDVYFGLASEEHFLKLKSRPEFLSVEEFSKEIKEENVEIVADISSNNIIKDEQFIPIHLPKPGSKEYIRMIKNNMKK